MVKWVVCLGILFGAAAAQSQDAMYSSANRALSDEDYQTASKLYEDILAQGYEHDALYYNLGNAYYRQGHTGLAVWAYEKGLRLNPRNVDLKYNLSIVNAQIRDRIPEPEMLFIVKWYRCLKSSFSMRYFIFVGVALFFLAGLLYNIHRLVFRLPFGMTFIGILIIAGLISHGFALDKYWDISDTQEAVVTEEEVPAYSAPFQRSDLVLFKVHEGVKVEVVQSQESWMEIILLDGNKGWIQARSVRVI